MTTTANKVDRKTNEVYVYSSDGQLVGYGGISKSSPLSNFYKTSFTYSGHRFQYSECAIMYEKAITFGDHKTADNVLKCTTPAAAKRLGRRVKPFDPKKWRDVRDEKVPQILYEKFTQNQTLKDWLISTSGAVLAEIAIQDITGRIKYKDRIWGVTIGQYHQDIDKPSLWHKYGDNFLGNTLMSVRQTILDETEDQLISDLKLVNNTYKSILEWKVRQITKLTDQLRQLTDTTCGEEHIHTDDNDTQSSSHGSVQMNANNNNLFIFATQLLSNSDQTNKDTANGHVHQSGPQNDSISDTKPLDNRYSDGVQCVQTLSIDNSRGI
ncbi:unnamed protein product, partial [Oppiella nova]